MSVLKIGGSINRLYKNWGQCRYITYILYTPHSHFWRTSRVTPFQMNILRHPHFQKYNFFQKCLCVCDIFTIAKNAYYY